MWEITTFDPYMAANEADQVAEFMNEHQGWEPFAIMPCLCSNGCGGRRYYFKRLKKKDF